MGNTQPDDDIELFSIYDLRPAELDPRRVIQQPGIVIDCFAGPGGWDEGLRATGYDGPLVGVEWEQSACATAEAAGHLRIHADVAGFPVEDIPGPVNGLIASPPCPGFSAASGGTGRDDLDAVRRRVDAWAAGTTPSDEAWADARSSLTAEPMRWAAALRPRCVALEQVPAVLPVWEHIAGVLETLGYSTWAGEVNAADYGVPQVRRRALMLARRDGVRVREPMRTHSEHGEGGLERWVTMAAALGWGMTERPYFTIASSRNTGGPDREKVGGSAAREALYAERAAGRWVHERPATTVQGDPGIWAPGHKVNQSDRDRLGAEEAERRYGNRAGTDAIRVSISEAAILQGFRPDYPWRGNSGRQFQQVGNAVPPPLAAAALRQVVTAAEVAA